jgi:integrative and conjugative element protein (TIGR02256 family)
MKRNTDRGEESSEHRSFPKRDDLELLLTESAVETIKHEVVHNPRERKETGGILIGGQAATNQFFIVEATGPGANANHQRTEFSPDVEHAQRRLDEMRKEWDVFWLGTWHKHPGSMQRLSEGDVQQMRRLVQDPDTLDEILSVIVTQNDDIRLRTYHMDDGLEAHRIDTAIVEDDIPIRKQFLRDAEPIKTEEATAGQDDVTENSVESEPGGRSDPTRETGEQSKHERSEEGDEEDFPRGGGETDGADSTPGCSVENHAVVDSSLDSDGGLSRADGTPRPPHVPRTATTQGLFEIGIRSINGVENPHYDDTAASQDEYEVVLSEENASETQNIEPTITEQEQRDELETTDSIDRPAQTRTDRTSFISGILRRFRR